MNRSGQEEGQARPGLLIGLGAVVLLVIGAVWFLKPGTQGNSSSTSVKNGADPAELPQNPSGDGKSGLNLIGQSKIGSRSNQDDQDGTSEEEQETLSQSFRKAMDNRIAAVREKELKHLAQQFASKDPGAALDLIKNEWENGARNKSPIRMFTSEFGKAYAKHDSKAAGAMTQSLPVELQMQYATSVGTQWASSDAGGATQWALGMSDPNIQSGLLSAISGVVDQSGSPFLIDPWADALTQSPYAGDYAQQLARTWPISNADAAMDWINAIPDPEIRAASFQSMAGGMAGRGYEDASHWVSQFPEEEGIRDQAVDQVSYSWSKSDYDAAKSWAESLGRSLLNENPNQPYDPQQP